MTSIPTPPSPNTATGMDDCASFNQQKAIRVICASMAWDPTEECQQLLGCKPEALNRKSASRFIDYLKAKKD